MNDSIIFVVIFSCFFQQVLSLVLTVQPNTFACQPSLLLWTREPVDGDQELDFNLRFVQGVDMKDAGVAVLGIHASPTQQFGTTQVVFPSPGTYQVIAVDNSNNTLGASNDVVAVALPSASSTTSSSTTATSTPTASTPVSRLTRPNTKTPIIVGSVFGTLVLLLLLAALIIFLIRRRRKATQRQRWTFHQDMMVQRRQPSFPSRPLSASTASHYSQDLEQGPVPVVPPVQLPSQDPEPRLPDRVVYPARITGLRGHRPSLRRLELDPSHHTSPPGPPIGPRMPVIPHSLIPGSTLPHSGRGISPALRSSISHSGRAISPALRSSIPRSPSPRTHRQRAIADQIEMLRIQMLELERKGNDYIGMAEMAEKLAWFREQQEGEWALGLTEETPVGYHRFMT